MRLRTCILLVSLWFCILVGIAPGFDGQGFDAISTQICMGCYRAKLWPKTFRKSL